MRIACFFTGRSAFGGAERRIGRIMNGVASRGIIVDFVFTLYEELDKVVEAYKRAIGSECLINFVGFHNGRDVFRHMIHNNYDAAFYVGAYRKMLPFFAGAKLSGSKTVLLQVSTGPSVGQFGSFLEKIEFSLIAKNSSFIDCLYPSTTDYFKNKYKHQIVNTTPCPATDLKRYQPNDKDKSIAFISRWVKGKNVELFVESVLSIENELFDNGYKVFLCGKSNDGVIENNVERLMQNAKHPDILVTPGYVDSEDILPRAEVFMSLQYINNYPSQSLLEAIACGCYIIASDEGDTRILVRPEFGSCCQLNVNSIAKAILDYIKKPASEKNKIVKMARSFAERKFNISDSVEHYVKIINQ